MRTKAGFTLVEVVVVVVLLSLVGGGVYVWQQKAQATSSHAITTMSATPAKPITSPTAVSDPTTGWQTYVSKQERLSFKYPSNWGLEPQATLDAQSDAVRITSPDDAVVIHYNSDVSGLGGVCGDPCPSLPVYRAAPFNVPGRTSGAYFLETQDGAFGLVSGDPKEAKVLYYYLLNSSNRPGINLWLYGEVSPTGRLAHKASDQIYADPIVKTAEQIIKSASYQP